MNTNGKSIHTTISGIATLLGAISALYFAIIQKDYVTAQNILLTTLIPVAYGLFKGKDANVTGAGSSAVTVTKSDPL